MHIFIHDVVHIFIYRVVHISIHQYYLRTSICENLSDVQSVISVRRGAKNFQHFRDQSENQERGDELLINSDCHVEQFGRKTLLSPMKKWWIEL